MEDAGSFLLKVVSHPAQHCWQVRTVSLAHGLVVVLHLAKQRVACPAEYPTHLAKLMVMVEARVSQTSAKNRAPLGCMFIPVSGYLTLG